MATACPRDPRWSLCHARMANRC